MPVSPESDICISVLLGATLGILAKPYDKINFKPACPLDVTKVPTSFVVQCIFKTQSEFSFFGSPFLTPLKIPHFSESSIFILADHLNTIFKSKFIVVSKKYVK